MEATNKRLLIFESFGDSNRCTPCRGKPMHCMICLASHTCTFALDPTEPESEFQAEQAQGVFGGLQASSHEDANIVVIKASPGASHQSPCLLCLKFYLYSNNMSV
jgi:hypothetical protein